MWIAVVVSVVTALIGIGVWARGAEIGAPVAGLLAGAGGVATYLAVVWTHHQTGIPAGDIHTGASIAGAAVGAASGAYVGIGALLRSHRIAGAVAALLSAPALLVGGFIVLLVVAGYVSCGPDAYECPV